VARRPVISAVLAEAISKGSAEVRIWWNDKVHVGGGDAVVTARAKVGGESLRENKHNFSLFDGVCFRVTISTYFDYYNHVNSSERAHAMTIIIKEGENKLPDQNPHVTHSKRPSPPPPPPPPPRAGSSGHRFGSALNRTMSLFGELILRSFDIRY